MQSDPNVNVWDCYYVHYATSPIHFCWPVRVTPHRVPPVFWNHYCLSWPCQAVWGKFTFRVITVSVSSQCTGNYTSQKGVITTRSLCWTLPEVPHASQSVPKTKIFNRFQGKTYSYIATSYPKMLSSETEGGPEFTCRTRGTICTPKTSHKHNSKDLACSNSHLVHK